MGKKLKFDNEPARHKLLDVIGDLALIGMPIKGHIITKKPGHKLNTSFAQILKKAMKDQEKLPKQFDLTKKPLYDIVEIEKMLPHRYPFLLIDKIMEISDDGIIGVKNVTMNENYFMGHFPKNPVMPGVLIVEAMAQASGILGFKTMNKKPEDGSIYYFVGADDLRFKRPAIPGDKLILNSRVITDKKGIWKFDCRAELNNEIVCSATILCADRKAK